MPVSGHPELEVLVGADLGQRTQLEPVVFGRLFKLQVFGGFGGARGRGPPRRAAVERERTRQVAGIGCNLNQTARWANIHALW